MREVQNLVDPQQYFPERMRAWERPLTPFSITLGNFDGVHLGHQQLLKESVAWARANKGQSFVLTFEPHPAEIFQGHGFTRLFDRKDQWEQVLHWGLDGLLIKDFKPHFFNLSPESFLTNFLQTELAPQHIVVGENFAFGKKRAGNISLLREWSSRSQIDVAVIGSQTFQTQIVSTSEVKNLLKNGNPRGASHLLGRNYYLRGIVVRGHQRGQTIQFPTANLQPTVKFEPALGVYVSQVWLEGAQTPLRSVTNIGKNPTVTASENIKIETHILDFSEDLYGASIKVELLDFLRGEMKFAGLLELREQIAKDVVLAKQWISKGISQ